MFSTVGFVQGEEWTLAWTQSQAATSSRRQSVSGGFNLSGSVLGWQLPLDLLFLVTCAGWADRSNRFCV